MSTRDGPNSFAAIDWNMRQMGRANPYSDPFDMRPFMKSQAEIEAEANWLAQNRLAEEKRKTSIAAEETERAAMYGMDVVAV